MPHACRTTLERPSDRLALRQTSRIRFATSLMVLGLIYVWCPGPGYHSRVQAKTVPIMRRTRPTSSFTSVVTRAVPHCTMSRWVYLCSNTTVPLLPGPFFYYPVYMGALGSGNPACKCMVAGLVVVFWRSIGINPTSTISLVIDSAVDAS
jgi:hypothetical protein